MEYLTGESEWRIHGNSLSHLWLFSKAFYFKPLKDSGVIPKERQVCSTYEINNSILKSSKDKNMFGQ